MLPVYKYVYKCCDLSLGSSNSRPRGPVVNERRFNKPVQDIWICAGGRCNIHTWLPSPYICHHKKNICFEIVNLGGPYNWKSEPWTFQNAKKKENTWKIVFQTRPVNHSCQSIQKCWKCCIMKKESCYQNIFQVICSCQKPTVPDFASSLCARNGGCDKDILTRECAPTRIQNNSIKFNSTKKKYKSVVSWH